MRAAERIVIIGGILGRAGGSLPPANTLVAVVGTFIVTGDDMAPLVYRLLPSSAAAFPLTGQAAGTLYGRLVTAAQATFTLTGIAANLTKSGATARQFADINTYLNTSTTSRSFSSFDHYVVA